jgi:endogenous inhibitor of DNA gyrase (YacG/DUF329 family)
MKKSSRKIKQCPQCQKYFDQNTNSQIYCSKECQKAADQQMKQDSYKTFEQERKKRKKNQLDKKIKNAFRQGTRYAELQKKETIEMFGRVEL